jgi:hypothetical protein
MPWTLDEIENEWLGGERLQLSPEDVVYAFDVAEQALGREWVLSTTRLPGGKRLWGFRPFSRVYAFGKRMQAIAEAPGGDALLERLLQGDAAAESELTAIYLLRSRRPDTEVEVGPKMIVGDHYRLPDFRIRSKMNAWTYVEVTQLNPSMASMRTQEALRRIADSVISIQQPFLLEIVFWRDPMEGEENELVTQAYEACKAADGERREVGDLASLMVKSGDPAVVMPSILPEGDGTRMDLARAIVGPGQPNRQVLVRAPFADQRAENILTMEAKQLPKDESGLVMVDATKQPTAFESWAKLVPPRFTPAQHTRVGGVLLFMTAITLTTQGMTWLPSLKLIPNPHASIPLSAWITEVIEETRAESRRLTGRSD